MAPRLSTARSTRPHGMERGWHDSGQQRARHRHPQPSGCRGAGPEHGSLPRRQRGPDASGEHRGGGIAPTRHRVAPLGSLASAPAPDAGQPGQRLRDTLGRAERRRRGAERGGENAGEQCRGDLVASFGQQARRADARDLWAEPTRLFVAGLGDGNRRIGYSTLINGLSLSLDVPFVAVNAMVGPVLVALAWSRHVIPRPWDDRAAGGGRLHRLRRDVLGR